MAENRADGTVDRALAGTLHVSRRSRDEMCELGPSIGEPAVVCTSSQQVQRNIRVARIYESQLNFPAAFASYLGALPSTSLGGGLGSVFFGLLKSGGVCSVPILALAYFVRRRRKRRKQRTEGQGAAPNGGPATSVRNSGVAEGPPSVS